MDSTLDRLDEKGTRVLRGSWGVFYNVAPFANEGSFIAGSTFPFFHNYTTSYRNEHGAICNSRPFPPDGNGRVGEEPTRSIHMEDVHALRMGTLCRSSGGPRSGSGGSAAREARAAQNPVNGLCRPDRLDPRQRSLGKASSERSRHPSHPRPGGLGGWGRARIRHRAGSRQGNEARSFTWPM